MTDPLRIAFFPDTFLEVNGAAMTCRRLAAYAEEKGYPFLCVYAGNETNVSHRKDFIDLKLKRSPLSFEINDDLKYDPFFNRHIGKVTKHLEEFRPDVIHITGYNDVGIIGAWLAFKFQVPLLGSWHTNVHEFAATRLHKMFSFVPDSIRNPVINLAERKILDGSILFYKMPKVVLAPNEELTAMLGNGTSRIARIMSRGVDHDFFNPEKRTVNDGIIRLGFVGRLRAEKNVRLLADIEKKLVAAGVANFKFLIVGDGSERRWLEENLQNAEFTGFIDGEPLAEAYANMDIFLFPSETDAFGNVVQEANCSGVPAIVTNLGGPKFIVKHGETGFIAENADDFTKRVQELMDNPEKLAKMKQASREHAYSSSWDVVFEKVYDAYQEAIDIQIERHQTLQNKLKVS